MSEEEKHLLRRKWEYKNKWRPLTQAMGKMEGFEILDLTNEGTVRLSDYKTEFVYLIEDRTLEIHFPFDNEKSLRLRICELAADKLVVAVSAKTGDDKLSKELVELEYAPMSDNNNAD